MSDYAVMPMSDYQDICNAVREKTGCTELLKSGEVAGEVRGIEAGGGGEWTVDDIALCNVPTGDITLTSTEVKAYAFFGRKNLTSVKSDTVTSIASNGFRDCQSLATFYMPKLYGIGQNAFYNCFELKELVLPSCGRLDYGALTELTGLEKLDIGENLSKTSGTVFAYCSSLKTIILRRSTGIVTMSNVNDFNNTPFAINGTGGTVYVPSALIETYKTATNWSTLYAAGTCNFVAIEGSEYE